MKRVDLSKVKIANLLGDCFNWKRGKELPEGIIGSTILNFGTIPEYGAVEGGGLVIEYKRSDTGQSKRVVLGFNELGMWIDFLGRCPRQSQGSLQQVTP